MILPDVNVLIYAFRPDLAQHAICRPWLESVVSGESQFGLSPLALSAVLRIATNPRIFKEPSTLQETIGFCNDLLEQPHCQAIEPGERHWGIFTRLCVETDTRGARITDAYFAALAIEWGCRWMTLDRDFARFPGLDWQAPGN